MVFLLFLIALKRDVFLNGLTAYMRLAKPLADDRGGHLGQTPTATAGCLNSMVRTALERGLHRVKPALDDRCPNAATASGNECAFILECLVHLRYRAMRNWIIRCMSNEKNSSKLATTGIYGKYEITHITVSGC
ncbi:hypothetical protein [Nostoc sp.]|uniref:hypothetical protein n=1 Tax=Nostoc sp. TaxID=1180 RepID=UPI003FA558F1